MAKASHHNPKVGDVVVAFGQNVILQVVEAPHGVGSTKFQPFSIGKHAVLEDYQCPRGNL